MPTNAVAKWALGMAALWVVLTALAESQDGAELAAVTAVLISSSATVLYGPAALKTLGY